MFEISKYKKSNVKISIRLPENMNETLRKIAKKENMSYNNVIVSCIQNSLDEMDLSKYKDIELYDNKELNKKPKASQNFEMLLVLFIFWTIYF